MKVIVAVAINGGLISLRDAHQRWGVSIEEYQEWNSELDGRHTNRTRRLRRIREWANAQGR
jgi:hypothetical protein